MLAIIPARGGSKGLPGKNIKMLAGKPLLAYTIEAALKSELISKIFVSTDSEEIAEVARAYNIGCDELRPPHLATDEALALDVYRYTLDLLESQSGKSIKEFMVLQPTSPLRTCDDIDNAVTLFREKHADSLISYTPEAHPITWHKYISKDGKIEKIFDNILKNRQMSRNTYYPNGSIYIFKKKLMDQGKYFTDNSFAFIMDRDKSIDIDTKEEFDFAEYIINKNRK